MSERRELTPDIIERLGLDPKAGWTENLDEALGEVWVNGKCGTAKGCWLKRGAIYNIRTGIVFAATCPIVGSPQASRCFWGGKDAFLKRKKGRTDFS